MAGPADGRTAAGRELAFFALTTNRAVDLQNAVIVDVDATTSIRPEARRCHLESVSGAHPGSLAMQNRGGVREKFGLQPNLC